MIKLECKDFQSLNESLNIKIKKAEDFFIEPHNSLGEEELYLEGNFFLFNCSDKYYYHILRDYVAHFELLSKNIKNLTPVSVCTCRMDEDSGTSCIVKNAAYPPHLFINKVYKNKILKIDGLKYKKVTFSRMFFCYAYSHLLDHFKDFEPNKIFPTPTEKAWVEERFGEELRNLAKSHIKTLDKNKKIYVTRINDSKYVWDFVAAWELYEKNKVLPENKKLKLDVLKMENTLPGSKDPHEIAKSRSFSVEDELLLENYFRSKGYEVINPGDYSVEEQIEIFSSSSFIAGAGGSGMTNLFFCHPETKIILLSAGSLFKVGSLGSVASTNNKKVSVFPADLYKSSYPKGFDVKYSAVDLIEEIEASGVEI